jgi:hypothetical protein
VSTGKPVPEFGIPAAITGRWSAGLQTVAERIDGWLIT